MYKYRLMGKKRESEKVIFFSYLKRLFSSDYNVVKNFFEKKYKKDLVVIK